MGAKSILVTEGGDVFSQCGIVPGIGRVPRSNTLLCGSGPSQLLPSQVLPRRPLSLSLAPFEAEAFTAAWPDPRS